MKKAIASIYNLSFSNFKFVLFFCCVFILGQNLAQANSNPDYLTIVVEAENGIVETVTYYPAGTTFLAGNSKKMSADYYPNEGRAFFKGDVQLTIYPSYRKDKPEKLSLENKIVKLYFTDKAATAAGFGDNNKTWSMENHAPQKIERPVDKSTSFSSANNLSAEKVVTKSEIKTGEYNVTVNFSNGIIFKYEDGKATATLKDKDLKVKGNYLVATEMGLLKVSFDSGNAELWWVFEKNEAE